VRLALAAALLFALSGSGIAAAASVQFRTPSGNIGCAFSSPPASLRCDILSGLRPRPTKPQGCRLDWGLGYSLGPTGRARVVCAGDTAVDRRAKALRYGRTWSRGGVAYTSRVAGLRCTNRSGHGLFLSRLRSYRF
jgi:hypothetical protein